MEAIFVGLGFVLIGVVVIKVILKCIFNLFF